MAKIKLVYFPGKDSEYLEIRAHFLNDIFTQHFEFIKFDASAVYDKDTVFVNKTFADFDQLKQLNNQGHRVVIDNLAEAPIETDYYQLTNKNWFWYRESEQYRALGYHNYTPDKTYSSRAFMPINLVKPARDQLVSELQPWLDEFIYSYKEITLPMDLDKSNNLWTRYFNPLWYDSTYFSVVAETQVSPLRLGRSFITEKTFKPVAFYHPFLILGYAGLLKDLKQQGFETFENLFDESYDTELDFNKRLKIIVENVKNFNKVSYNRITQEKLEHNHNLFFNEELITQRIKEEIVNPLLEYVNS